MADKRVSSIGPRAGAPARMGAAVPLGLPPILRRFWDFTRKQAKNFSKHLLRPEEHEEEFVKAVRDDFKRQG